MLVFGEDVGYFGGVFRATEGLQKKYGLTRCFDTPIAEGGIIGVAVGMGAYGLRPVVEIQFADYIYPAYDQIVSEAARLRYRSAGEFTAPITVRTPYGGGIFGGQTHSQSPEALFTHVAGLKTVIPSNPYDAKGLLIAAIEDDDPVHLPRAQAHLQRPVRRPSRPPGARPGRSTRRARCPRATTPCRSARRRSCARARTVTVLAYGTMVHVALAAARGDRHRRRGDRPAHPRAARHRDHRGLGEEDRPLRHRARGDADLRLRRRAVGAGAGALLLSPGGADRARHRLGHALSARLRVGVFPGPGARRRGAASRAMEG